MVLSRSHDAESAELRAAIIVAEKECCVIPQGLPGTAVRGPACTVVWEPGGETLRATRFAGSPALINLGEATRHRLVFGLRPTVPVLADMLGANRGGKTVRLRVIGNPVHGVVPAIQDDVQNSLMRERWELPVLDRHPWQAANWFGLLQAETE